MKKLLMALAACATTLLASAAINTRVGFEVDDTGTFDGIETGGSEVVEYVSTDTKPTPSNYPFPSAGSKYCEVDADETYTLVSPAASDATCFDMYIQFPANASEPSPDVDSDAKLAVYVNASSNLVVISGGATPTNVTETKIEPGAWKRLTIAKVGDGYKVYVEGTAVRNGAVFAPIKTGTPSTVAFTGCGKLDNFVARTTDPFYSGAYVASIGGDDGEKYASLDDALTDYPAATFTLNDDATTTKVLANRGDTFSIELNGHSLSGLTASGLLVPVASTSGDVTTYTADYFPRTATARQDGSAEHPFEIADVDDLQALSAAVAADANFRNKCYVQKADIALTEAWAGIGIQNGKDKVAETEFDEGAFTGTYDGDNHTISGFQMVGQDGNPANVGKESSKWEGLDYCGFFNSTYNATIKNLKIQYAGSLFAADTTASTKESGATFVGVAKNSTLQNLTSLQKDAETAVSCSKGFGGIVGYTTSGTTVDSCTNNVNMTSLANNKCGGIAMITQNGNAVTIRNCQNNGTQTTRSSNSEYGAIVGYVGLDTTISNCETTVGRFLKHQGNTVTLQGVNKGDAHVASYHGAATPGLNFATVDGDVATFVADNALALNGSYKVMATNAVATFEFDAAGTIAFDTALFTPEYAITCDRSTLLEPTSTTGDGVTTYTADAGVASVNNVAYATLADAVEAAGAEDVITILTSGLTYQFTQAGSIKLDQSLATATITADTTTLVLSNETADGVTTYTADAGVASVNNVAYVTLAAAVEAAGAEDVITILTSGLTYQFTQAGSIKLDQSLATATVTADTSTLVLSDETVNNVTTYTAVAGVASVGGQAYATMQNAFDAVTAQNNTVTLLADLTETVTLNPDETVTITLVSNNHHIATANPFAAANGIALGEMSENGDGTWSMNVINNKASTWTGTAGDELWATASNWSTGAVPGEYTTVTFNDDGRVRIASNNDVVSVAGMVVNAAVTFSETNINYNKYPAVKICGGNVTGTGTLTLERCGLSGNSSQVEVGCDLVFKGDSATTHDCFLKEGPFVFNGAVSSTLGRLHLLTPVTFNGSVTLGNATMTSTVSGGAAPTFNGPVTLNSGASITTYAVTYNNALTIGDGAVVSVGSTSQTYGDNFVLTGSGRFIGDTVDVGAKVKTAFQDSNSWTGTYEIKGRNHSGGSGKDMGSAWWLTAVGNVDSKVCFNGVTTYLNNSNSGSSSAHGIAGIEIGAGGLTLDGGYKGGNWELPSLSGTGTLTIAATGSSGGNAEKAVIFPADCSDFAGNIAFGDDESINVRVVFGTSERTFAAKSIVVGSGAEVGAGAWTAANGIFVDGTVSLASASSALTVPEGGVVGSGKIVASAVPATAPALDADNWTGTFVADWEGEVLSANKGKRIDFNSYGTANSIVEVTKLARGYDGTGSDYTVVPTVKVSGTMTLDNGYSGKITTLTKLTGSGAVTFKNYTVNITTLDNFSGTLTPTDATGTTIGTINLETTPAAGTKIVSLGENAKVNIKSTKVSVSGVVDDTIKLELKSDGIYVAEPPAPKVAEVVGGEQYETLAEALAAATDGATVKLLANIVVTEMQLVTKSVTLDLNGFAITAGERSAEAATAGDDSILCVLHGGSLTINDSSAGGTGAITGNSVFTSAVKMTKKGDTDDTKKAVLVVNGGTLTGYYYGISGNGLAGRGNTEVTINDGSVYGSCTDDSVAIFQPQLGTLTINGGYLEGAMGVYVKSGTATVAINGGTIKGKGTYAAYKSSTNGFNNTGDAFVVDNAGYPGGAPAPSILGGTFVSVNASAIASYAATGLERIVHFADKDAVTITEAVASAEDVFLEKGFPGGEDGKTFTIDTAVQAALEAKLPAGKALTDAVAGTTSGVTYAQAYALGLLDEKTGDVEKDVTPTIEVKNGKVVVSLDATAKAGYKVMLNVYEKSSLTAEWPAKPTKSYELKSAEDAGFEPSNVGAGFYKVGVTIEDAE